MNIVGLRSIGPAVLLVLLAGAGCNRPKRASLESSAAPTHSARYPTQKAAHQMDDGALRKRAAGGGLRPQVFLIVEWGSKGPGCFAQSNFRYQTAVDGQ
jgi:hypothetical protein